MRDLPSGKAEIGETTFRRIVVRPATVPRMKSQVLTKWLAIFFLALALALVGGLGAMFFWPKQDALSCRVELRPGFSVTRQFRVPKKAEYRIEIRCSR